MRSKVRKPTTSRRNYLRYVYITIILSNESNLNKVEIKKSKKIHLKKDRLDRTL